MLPLFADAECLQRAVEGRAASDEEEEDRGLREGSLEAKKHISRLHNCSKGLACVQNSYGATCFSSADVGCHSLPFPDVR